MCGQFAVVGVINLPQRKFINNMFVLDSVRGPDSSGLTQVDKKGESVITYKDAVHGSEFIDDVEYAKYVASASSALIGHNRWATAGAVNVENSHPFMIGNITGQHNGTLLGQWRLPDSTKFKVDSKNIVHSIDKVGIDETWKLIDGPAALMWWDLANGTFNMIRNSERPIWFGYSKDLKQMYAASEHYMLMAAAERNDIIMYDLVELPVDTLYTFKVDYDAKEPKNVVKCSTRKLEALDAYESTPWWSRNSNPAKDVVVKKEGEMVEFTIQTAYTGQYGDSYSGMDKLGADYVLESYNNHYLDLEVGDVVKGKVSYFYLNEAFISPNSVKVVKRVTDVIVGEIEEQMEDDIPFDSQLTLAYDNKDLPNDVCACCSSPVQKGDTVMVSGGEVYCDDCAEMDWVKEYIQLDDIRVV